MDRLTRGQLAYVLTREALTFARGAVRELTCVNRSFHVREDDSLCEGRYFFSGTLVRQDAWKFLNLVTLFLNLVTLFLNLIDLALRRPCVGRRPLPIFFANYAWSRDAS
jgi:hypothetical protein